MTKIEWECASCAFEYHKDFKELLLPGTLLTCPACHSVNKVVLVQQPTYTLITELA